MPVHDQMKRERHIRRTLARNQRRQEEQRAAAPRSPTVRVNQVPDNSQAAVIRRLKEDARKLGMNPEAILAVSRLKREMGMDEAPPANSVYNFTPLRN